MQSYITPFDTSTWKEASELSCKHMRELAIKELNENKYYDNKTLYHPAWERFHQFSDRNLELKIQKGSFINKKSCINKRPDYNKGKWENSFAVYNPNTECYGCDMHINFIENTKSKMQNNMPCSYEEVLVNNGINKNLTTNFNQEYFETWDKIKKNSDNIIDRYNNHNPVIGDEFTRPATLRRHLPQPIEDPNYKPYNKYIHQPIRNPSGVSDCSTLYNFNRYDDNQNNMEIYLEPCSKS